MTPIFVEELVKTGFPFVLAVICTTRPQNTNEYCFWREQFKSPVILITPYWRKKHNLCSPLFPQIYLHEIEQFVITNQMRALNMFQHHQLMVRGN